MKDHGGFEPRDRGWGRLRNVGAGGRIAILSTSPRLAPHEFKVPLQRKTIPGGFQRDGWPNWSERDRHLRSAQPAATPNDTRTRRFLPGLQEPSEAHAVCLP